MCWEIRMRQLHGWLNHLHAICQHRTLSPFYILSSTLLILHQKWLFLNVFRVAESLSQLTEIGEWVMSEQFGVRCSSSHIHFSLRHSLNLHISSLCKYLCAEVYLLFSSVYFLVSMRWLVNTWDLRHALKKHFVVRVHFRFFLNVRASHVDLNQTGIWRSSGSYFDVVDVTRYLILQISHLSLIVLHHLFGSPVQLFCIVFLKYFNEIGFQLFLLTLILLMQHDGVQLIFDLTLHHQTLLTLTLHHSLDTTVIFRLQAVESLLYALQICVLFGVQLEYQIIEVSLHLSFQRCLLRCRWRDEILLHKLMFQLFLHA